MSDTLRIPIDFLIRAENDENSPRKNRGKMRNMRKNVPCC
jgi:hypothetical protein